TAALIARGLVVDALDWSVDISPSPRWSVSAGGGGAWLSDSNSRYSAVVAVLARVASGVQVGPFARVMGYHLSGPRGYFAPDRFRYRTLGLRFQQGLLVHHPGYSRPQWLVAHRGCGPDAAVMMDFV